jgi:hypothetical protein
MEIPFYAVFGAIRSRGMLMKKKRNTVLMKKKRNTDGSYPLGSCGLGACGPAEHPS